MKRKKIISTVFTVIISMIVILIIGDEYWRYKRYVEMGKPRVKENLTEEEMEIIYKEFGLISSKKYKIDGIYYQFSEEIRAYIFVGEDLDEFLEEVCGWSEEYTEEMKKELYCDGELKREYILGHTDIFGNEVTSVKLYLNKNETRTPEMYIWKDEKGYVVEIARDSGYFVDAKKIKEMFPDLKWISEVEWIKRKLKG